MPGLAPRFLPSLDWDPEVTPFVNFNGTSGNDIFNGGAADDSALGYGGNDRLTGGGGNDVMAGGAGEDEISGDEGNDLLYSADDSPGWTRPGFGPPPLLDTGVEYDMVRGGVGADTIFAGYGDLIDGGANNDILLISFLGASQGVTVDFRLAANAGSVTVGGGVISSIESLAWVEGSDFDDDITVGDSPDGVITAFFGGAGNDRLVGGRYAGAMYGGDGDDIIDCATAISSSYGCFGEAGNDLIIGGSRFDRLEGGDGDDELRGYVGGDVLIGGEGNDLLDGGSWYDTLIGGAGDDRLYGAGDNDTLDGGDGADLLYGDSGLFGTNNGTSLGNNDLLFGGLGADSLYGELGDDTLWSAERNGSTASGLDDAELDRDRLFGGVGNDFLAVGYGDDADGGADFDSVRLSLLGAAGAVSFSTAGFTPGGSWSLFGGTIANIEVLTTILGSRFADQITVATHGFGVTVESGDGADVLTASGSSVVFRGGNGDDRFINGLAADLFDGGAGTDTVVYRAAASGITARLGGGAGSDTLIGIENVEGSDFGDTIEGDGGANLLLGFAGSDSLFGFAGNDRLYGGADNDVLNGGVGSDLMEGGSGDDQYLVDRTADQNQVIERAGEGNDIVFTLVNYRLAAGQEIEELAAANPGSTGRLDLTGNEFNNRLYGNSGLNVIVGGAGADIMGGLGGNDQYLVDNAGDRIIEAVGGGNDIVFTSVSFALLSGQEVEELSAANGAATTRLDLTGNEFANRLYGNAGVNVLIGGGGADLMNGFGGDDQYLVDNAGDQVAELAGGGYDIVFAVANYTLAAGVAVERLSAVAGAGSLNLFGNGLANAVIGNASINVLAGGGGDDTLFGGGGADSFVFNEAFAVAGVDRILDFGAGVDKIALDDSAFAGLASVSASNFVTSQTGAQNGAQRIIYDNAAGALFFDADGNGAGAAVLFAVVTPGLALNAADFVVI